MEEYTQITLDQWMQWKEDIRQKLTETAGNFVHIGYRLKQIRDSGMFGGAADIFEFAEQEYGLGKSTTSRFIAINEKYSEGGNSLYLREEFRNFSSSKLAEMLTLPDAECQLITDKTTIKEIRELKSFSRQQAAEEPEETQHTPLEKCIIDFFSGKQKLLNTVMGFLSEEEPEYKAAEEELNPSGQGSHRKGIVFLFFYDWTTGVKYKLMTQKEPVSMTWTEFLNEVYKIYAGYDQGDIWADFYKDQEQENEPQEAVGKTKQSESDQGFQDSVATSQQNGKGDENQNKNEQEKINRDNDERENGKEGSRNGMSEDIEEEIETEEEYSGDKETTGIDEIGVESESDEDEIGGGDGKADIDEGSEIEDPLAAGQGETVFDAEKTKKDSGRVLKENEQIDIMQFEEYMPEKKCNLDMITGYLDALRDILDNIYSKAEQMQYDYAEDLLEAAKGTLRKIVEVSGQNEEHNA